MLTTNEFLQLIQSLIWLLAGVGVTAIIQSSSATSVMVIGLVNAGYSILNPTGS